MNGYWNFHHNRSLSHDAAHGELGEANLGLFECSAEEYSEDCGDLRGQGSPAGFGSIAIPRDRHTQGWQRRCRASRLVRSRPAPKLMSGQLESRPSC